MKVIRQAAVVVGTVAQIAAVVATATGNPGLGATLQLVAAAAGAVATVSTLAMRRPTEFGAGSQTDFKANPDEGIPYIVGRTQKSCHHPAPGRNGP